MPKLKNRPPSYRLHRCSGQATVTLNGRDHYLGVYESPESRVAYQRLVGEWLGKKTPPLPSDPDRVRDDLRISELLVAYLEFAACPSRELHPR
jgi:hypothetical protein